MELLDIRAGTFRTYRPQNLQENIPTTVETESQCHLACHACRHYGLLQDPWSQGNGRLVWYRDRNLSLRAVTA